MAFDSPREVSFGENPILVRLRTPVWTGGNNRGAIAARPPPHSGDIVCRQRAGKSGSPAIRRYVGLATRLLSGQA
jgi:hypothetical protein